MYEEEDDDKKKRKIGDVGYNTDLFSDTQLFGSELTTIGQQSASTPGLDKTKSDIQSISKTLNAGDIYDQIAGFENTKNLSKIEKQQNLMKLIQPTVNVWKERNERTMARAQVELNANPLYDDSILFGQGKNTPIPIGQEIIGLSQQIRDDIVLVNKIGKHNPEKEVVRKRIEENQSIIAGFDEVNKKLLALRNESEDKELNYEDFSQRMSSGEFRMWADIYSSNGENIKIIDGKLMWVDPGGVKYNLEDAKKLEFLGGEETSLGILNSYTTKYSNKEANAPKDKESIKKLQLAMLELFPNETLGGTGDDENGVDGVWGDKSKALYTKYLKVKDKLEKAELNKVMTDPEKVEYTVKGIGGPPIDLSTIDSNPAKKEYEAFNLGKEMTVRAQQLSVNGAGIEEITRQLGQDWNTLSANDKSSLLFDGMDASDKGDINTTEFIDAILEKNEVGYNEMGAEERADALDRLISRGISAEYKDPFAEPGDVSRITGNVEDRTLSAMFKDWYIDKRSGRVDAQTQQAIQQDQQKQYAEAVEERSKKIKELSYTNEDYITNTKDVPKQIMSETSSTGSTSVPITTDANLYIRGENPSQSVYNYTHPTNGQNIPTTKSDYIWDHVNKRWVTTQYFDEDRGFEKGGGNGGGGSHFQPIGDRNLIKILNAEADGWGGHEARDKVFSAVRQMQEGNKMVIKMPTGPAAGSTLVLEKLDDGFSVPQLAALGLIPNGKSMTKQQLYSFIGMPNHFDIMQIGGTDDDQIIYAKKGSNTPYKTKEQKEKDEVGHSNQATKVFKHPAGTLQSAPQNLDKNGHPYNRSLFGDEYYYDVMKKEFRKIIYLGGATKEEYDKRMKDAGK